MSQEYYPNGQPKMPDFWDTIFQKPMATDITRINLSGLHDFGGHTFKVLENDDFSALVESIRVSGVKEPLIVRPHPTIDEAYEIISGHRRAKAADRAGLISVPCIVENLSDADAVILMAESNLQRPGWLPSERARTYKAHLEAVLSKSNIRAGRPKENLATRLPNFENVARNRNIAAKTWGISGQMFDAYIKLNDLLPPLLDMTDEGRIMVKAAYQFAFLSQEDQQIVLDFLRKYPKKKVPGGKAKEIRETAEVGELTEAYLERLFGLVAENRQEKKINISLISDTVTYSPTIRAALEDPDVLLELENVIIRYAKENDLPLK